MNKLIGRKHEQNELLRLYNGQRSEFVAVYGRRRVGKTYLIKELFQSKFDFYHTGLAPAFGEDEVGETNDTKSQLRHFLRSLQRYGYKGKKCPSSWLDAFYMLEDLLEQNDSGERQVVFIDELPWMDTKKSRLITAIDAFWNSWCNGRNILLIICGSAASWMLDNVIEDKGGLYGRLTYSMKLSPFTLLETEQYLNMLGVAMSRYDIAQAHMIVGGIPYYLNFWQPNMSLPQNVDNIMFSENAVLKVEFNRLFRSLFTNPEIYAKIVRFLSTRHCGYSRDEIIEHIGMNTGGTVSVILDALVASDFITLYQPFGNSKREKIYKLTDHYCWFYLKFIDGGKITDQHFWLNNYQSAATSSWRGLAFEELCFKHISQIKLALNIAGIVSTESSWTLKGVDNHDGSQIDMIISRNDNVVNLCEIKCYQDDYTVDKEEDQKMRRRITALQENLTRKQSLHVTLITTFGLRHSIYSGIFTDVITLDDLFK